MKLLYSSLFSMVEGDFLDLFCLSLLETQDKGLSCLRPIIDWLSSGLSLISVLAMLKAPDADMKARPHPFLLCVYDGFPGKVPRTPVIPAGSPPGSDLPPLHDLRQDLR